MLCLGSIFLHQDWRAHLGRKPGDDEAHLMSFPALQEHGPMLPPAQHPKTIISYILFNYIVIYGGKASLTHNFCMAKTASQYRFLKIKTTNCRNKCGQGSPTKAQNENHGCILSSESRAVKVAECP